MQIGDYFTNIFARLFLANKLRSFFCQWRLVNGTLIWQISPHLIWAKLEAECWWNWTAIFLPNTVRQQLFAWSTKFGEIDPCFMNIWRPYFGAKKFQTQNTALQFLAPKFCTKNECVKCWWNWLKEASHMIWFQLLHKIQTKCTSLIYYTNSK
jgi:hypothetical protein